MEGKGRNRFTWGAVGVVVVIGLAIALLGGAVGCAKPEEGPEGETETVRIAFASMPPTSSMYTGCVAMAQSVREYHPNIEITVMNVGGAVVGWAGILEGKYELCVGHSGVPYQIYHGLGKWEEDKKIRPLLPILLSQYHFVVSEESGVQTIEDLQGKKFCPGSRGTDMEVTCSGMFEAWGIQPEFWKGTYGDAKEKYLKGDIVGFVRTAEHGDAFTTEVCLTKPSRILSMTDEQRRIAVEDVLVTLSRETIPAGTYRGQDEAVQTVGFVSGIQSRLGGFSEDVGYQIIDGWSRGFDEYQRVLYPHLSQIEDPLEWLANTYVVPIHPGAVKYLLEKGYSVPDRCIGPEVK